MKCQRAACDNDARYLEPVAKPAPLFCGIHASATAVKLSDLDPCAHPGCVKIRYENHRSECTVRRIVPLYVWYGKTEWHPEPQWLLHAYDVAKEETRDFAVKGVLEWNV